MAVKTMQTPVVMKRKLLGGEISQHSKTEMLSATDLAKIGNKWRIANDMDPFTMKSWLSNKSTKEFIAELESRYGKDNVKKMARGRGTHTWFHPLLFIDMALSISPAIKIEAYQWLFDNLIRSRNESGDSYKMMCGALFVRCSRKTSFPAYISEVARKIKLACRVDDWNRASLDQLELRKKLHNDIALLADVMNNNDEAVRVAIKKAVESRGLLN